MVEEAKCPTVELTSLVGEHWLGGVDEGTIKDERGGGWDDCNTLTFLLDGVTYRAVEDPRDGYRSGLDRIDRIDGGTVNNRFDPVKVIGTHCTKPRDTIYGEDDVLELRDAETGELVVEVGTTNIDDYYPSYVGFFYPQAMVSNAQTP